MDFFYANKLQRNDYSDFELMYEIIVLDLEDISSNKQALSEWNLLFKMYSRS